MTDATPNRMPTLFIPHGGGPCFFMDDPRGIWTRMGDYLKGIAATLPERPKAIVVISGHWATDRFAIGSGAKPSLIFDYYGFPPHTYQLTYPAPGDPALADRIQALLAQAGIATGEDPERGYDHGVFVPLKLVFPDADIPVLPLSLRGDLDPVAHLAAGRALAPLRDEGVLIVGSGMSFHNMRAYGDPRYTPVSEAFDGWLTAAVEATPAARNDALAHWEQAPGARHCHPPRAEEHLIPLMVAAGAAWDGQGRKVFGDKVLETAISGFRFD